MYAISRYFLFFPILLAIFLVLLCFAVSVSTVLCCCCCCCCCCCVAVHTKVTHQVQPLRLRPQPKPNSSRFNRSAMSDPKRTLSHPNQIKNPIDHMRNLWSKVLLPLGSLHGGARPHSMAFVATCFQICRSRYHFIGTRRRMRIDRTRA